MAGSLAKLIRGTGRCTGSFRRPLWRPEARNCRYHGTVGLNRFRSPLCGRCGRRPNWWRSDVPSVCQAAIRVYAVSLPLWDQRVDLAGDVALQAADRLEFQVPSSDSLGNVGLRARIGSQRSDRDDVERNCLRRVSADGKLTRVFSLPCWGFEQRGKRGDHHGHDWQSAADAPTRQEVGARHWVAPDFACL